MITPDKENKGLISFQALGIQFLYNSGPDFSPAITHFRRKIDNIMKLTVWQRHWLTGNRNSLSGWKLYGKILYYDGTWKTNNLRTKERKNG